MEEHPITTQGKTIYKTISMGVCNFRNSDPPTRADLIKYADRALYMAKESGRNRYVVHYPHMENEKTPEKTTSPMQTGAFQVPKL